MTGLAELIDKHRLGQAPGPVTHLKYCFYTCLVLAGCSLNMFQVILAHLFEVDVFWGSTLNVLPVDFQILFTTTLILYLGSLSFELSVADYQGSTIFQVALYNYALCCIG